jgi:hypothetical protein
MGDRWCGDLMDAISRDMGAASAATDIAGMN